MEIVYEDEALAVLNKPSGMLSIPGRTEDYSIATWAQERWPGSQPVHRLDMWTSGIILVAKTNEAYHALQKQFTDHSVKKKYLAIVEGTPKQKHGIIDLPSGRRLRAWQTRHHRISRDTHPQPLPKGGELKYSCC